MTIQELVDRLRAFDGTREVFGLWDTMQWPVHRVGEVGGVVLIDVGSGHDGDWNDALDIEAHKKLSELHGYGHGV